MTTIAIGIKGKNCCIIKSNVNFAELAENFDKYKVEYSATSYGGYDTISRTLKLHHLKLTGRKFFKNAIAKGFDYDQDCKYLWAFPFNIVAEVEEDE